MSEIAQLIEKLELGRPTTYESLTVYPLNQAIYRNRDYLTLDEALQQGLARVTEVSESGSVPQLLFRNKADRAVFLLDGEELVGAKQNRVLNITILAPAGRDTIIPVSCVEAGRWRHTSNEFASAPRTFFSEGRARKAASVTASMSREAGPQSDQSEVWDEISIKMSRLGSYSETSAQEKMYQDHASRLDDYVKAFECGPSQVGGLFVIRGRVVGMELFDTVETCSQLLPKIIRSYALDAIDPGSASGANDGGDSPAQFLLRVAKASVSRHAAVGEGEDLRLGTDSGVAGGALFARERIVHLCAFAIHQDQRNERHADYGMPASIRRFYRS